MSPISFPKTYNKLTIAKSTYYFPTNYTVNGSA